MTTVKPEEHMSVFRSIFISAFIAFLLLAFFYGLVELLRGVEPAWSWLGMTLVAGGPLAFFGWVFVTKPARSLRHPLGNTLLSGLGLAMTMVMSWRFGETAGIIHIWSGLIFLFWIVYLRWYSVFQNRNSTIITPGNNLPEFELQDSNGEIIQSSSFSGTAHILLYFRGNWCPFCTAQVKELARQYQAIEAAGAKVAFISPQPLKKNQALARRLNIPVEFFCDPQSKAARLLGISDAWGTPMGLQLLGYDSDTVLPTVLIIDQAGVIIYAHQTDNYRLRPEPAEFLRVLTSYKA
jgi:peroxiredoxin